MKAPLVDLFLGPARESREKVAGDEPHEHLRDRLRGGEGVEQADGPLPSLCFGFFFGVGVVGVGWSGVVGGRGLGGGGWGLGGGGGGGWREGGKVGVLRDGAPPPRKSLERRIRTSHSLGGLGRQP